MFLLTSSQCVFGAHFPDSLRSALNRITGYIYDDRLEQAGAAIDSLATVDSPHPVTTLFRAVLYQSQMMAEESDRLEPSFLILLDSVETGADSILAAGGDSALAWYLIGQADALRSLRLGRSGHTWGAIKAGMAAGRAYSKGYAVDSQFYDIGLGLGSYRYWKSVKGRLLTWTFLLKNEKANGIELLRQAADSAEISADAAVTSLIWVYLNEERYGEAIRLTEHMHHKYPHGLTFVWALGEIFLSMHDWRSAAQVYAEILDRVDAAPGNYYNTIEASYCLIKCYGELAATDPPFADMATNIRNHLRTCPIPEEIRKKQVKKLSYILR